MSRTLRTLLLATLLTSILYAANGAAQSNEPNNVPNNYNEMTVAQLEAAMTAGTLTSEQLTSYYINRILALDQFGPGVNAVIELNPNAIKIARQMDKLRRHGIVLGPMHGIPVLLKDNVDTGDTMQTSAGSFALVGRPALHDSTVAANLRAGGAVILGKTNLSEWANFRSFESVSGWSGRGGQTNNPYGIARNPCGSSAGSAAAVSSNFAAVSFGTETDGSIVCPANANGVVGLKPTVGLTSRAGIVPISHTQDTFGPHGRYVADVAVALGVVQSRTYDGRDPATAGVPLGWQGRFPRPARHSHRLHAIPQSERPARRKAGPDADRAEWLHERAYTSVRGGRVRSRLQGTHRCRRDRHRPGCRGLHVAQWRRRSGRIAGAVSTTSATMCRATSPLVREFPWRAVL